MEKVKNILEKALKKSVFKRRCFFLISDILLISASMYISFWCRFNGDIPSSYKVILPLYILISLAFKMTFLVIYNLYDISWRFVSLETLIKVFKAISVGSLSFGLFLFLTRVFWIFQYVAMPRSVLLIDYIFSLILIGSLRISKRVLLEGLKSTFKEGRLSLKVLIVGAGSAGEEIVREMTRGNNSYYLPVGFVDDEPAKKGIKIHGIKVLGNRHDIPEIVKNNAIDDVLIAIPSSSSKDIREIVQIVRETGIVEKIKILPNMNDLIDGKVMLSDIHDIKLSDLLGRAAVNVEVTGAGGSIGSEIAESIIQFCPDSLMIFDIDETEIFYLVRKLGILKSRIIPIIGDIKDDTRLEVVFREFSPQIVLHAAAYKHVPILEFYPEEALKTNLMGTKVLAEMSMKYNVEKFIFISTDKAINPTSIMGASKRAGEELLRIFNQKDKTRFISVRFGNVLGSRGSVISLFKDQIKRGGPVTVTHPEMKRYFMITSEAVLLVLEAAAVGQGGEVFVLDMGEQIKIVDLAREMITLSAYQHDRDIPIVFTQIRPGEKLYEEILSAEEGVKPTDYEKLFRVRNSNKINSGFVMAEIDHLIEMSHQCGKREEIIKSLRVIVPTYHPWEMGGGIENCKW